MASQLKKVMGDRPIVLGNLILEEKVRSLGCGWTLEFWGSYENQSGIRKI